ncbi:MAG TPA: signal peptidase II [Acidimicrobiia bacterium]|nr:signal peptidase II [Acidimicrobiia bacterium]
MRSAQILIRRYLIGLGVAAAVVALDLWTKRLAVLNFADGDFVLIPGFLELTYVENPGVAFGFFPDGGTVVGIAALVIAIVVLVSLGTPRPGFETVVLGLVLGGAVGNLVDRVARGPGIIDGAVIDWVNLWVIPTFNVADASITIAVGLLLIHAWRSR